MIRETMKEDAKTKIEKISFTAEESKAILDKHCPYMSHADKAQVLGGMTAVAMGLSIMGMPMEDDKAPIVLRVLADILEQVQAQTLMDEAIKKGQVH